jgi:hypothetical protein
VRSGVSSFSAGLWKPDNPLGHAKFLSLVRVEHDPVNGPTKERNPASLL